MNRYFSSKVCVVLLLSAISYVWAQSASAACTPINGWLNKALNVTIPNIVIQRSAYVGTVIYSQPITLMNQQFATTCDLGFVKIYGNFNNGWNPNSNGVAPTNLSGIGVRIKVAPADPAADYFLAAGNKKIWTEFPVEDGRDGRGIAWGGEGLTFELVKTGPTSKGTLSTGTYGNISLNNSYQVALVNVVNGGAITTSGCTVNTKSLTVPLGSAKRSEFSGVGSTTKTSNFNISVDCIESTGINMTLNATADSSNAPGVIAIDPFAGTTTAKGVGIQLLRYNNPVVIGSSFVIGRASFTGENSIEMAARYYQTKSTVTAGQANATATFTLTYN
ncbi:fimbrial protein [Pseudomonas shahriarae]